VSSARSKSVPKERVFEAAAAAVAGEKYEVRQYI
jgi:hypothetical protein